MTRLHRGYLMNIQDVISDQEGFEKCFVYFAKHNTNEGWKVHQFYYGGNYFDYRDLMEDIDKWMDEHLSPTLTFQELMSVDGAGI